MPSSAAAPERIGLAVVGRPADVLPMIGWSHNWGALEHAAVLRSGRTGSAPGCCRSVSTRSGCWPRTLQAAQHVAAEHFTFGDTCTGKGLRDIPGIADELLATPIWTFWWD